VFEGGGECRLDGLSAFAIRMRLLNERNEKSRRDQKEMRNKSLRRRIRFDQNEHSGGYHGSTSFSEKEKTGLDRPQC